MTHTWNDSNPIIVETDVLVVGSGGAALRAALAANSCGADVLVAVKGNFARSGATFYSVAEVGAFNVPDGAADVSDSPDQFLQDILDAAQGMADPRLSRILVSEAAEAMEFLEKYGVVFDKKEDRYLAFQACFSSKPRAHVIQDHFKPIVKALGEEATRREIRTMSRLMVTNLIVDEGQCYGAFAIDEDGRSIMIRAKSTVLTTGGASQLFKTNLYPPDITGDGYAMAYRAGAQIANFEFMQAGISIVAPFINLFGNYLWDAAPRIANKEGESFIHKYAEDDLTVAEIIKAKERHFPFSSSDISKYIEISIQKEINQGGGTENGGVYLDFTSTDFAEVLANPNTSISKMWDTTYRWYLKQKVDLYKDKVEIACSAHAINGGVRIDQHGGSNIKGLFAAGEVAAGPHGADRLGGNMSVTCQVFGRRAGEAAAKHSQSYESKELPGIIEKQKQFINQFKGNGKHSLRGLKKELQEAANRHLLIIRNEKGLKTFTAKIKEIQDLLLNDTEIETPKDLIRAIELKNLIDVGSMMATAALIRKESRGSHYREDYPDKSGDWNKNIILDISKQEGYFTSRLEDIETGY
ncbi:FAD-binding protein [Ammoniphilus resinae]|uniref:L-aspartate oxidase n=1 Tax=Ammoniphilus resinae TaxID=861532 RepID=A0ABS4GQW9_9BACL|nr:FAD-binding protein [Ammoniphilus resinae]MBP1932659.1 L-aspartate oxidase [Ammoniphilus resinae]